MAATDFNPEDYWEGRLSANYSLGSVGWAGLGDAFNRWMYTVRRYVFRSAVLSATDSVSLSRSRVLDVGSGTGFYLDCWRGLGVKDLVGSDLTRTAVARLRLRLPDISIHQLDISSEELKPPEEPFDLVSVMDVLFHIVDDERYERAIRNLASMVKPGGLVILTENFVGRRRTAKHQVMRTRREIEQQIRAAGITPVLERPAFVLMNSPVEAEARRMQAWWGLLTSAVEKHEVVGWVMGATLLPIELALVRAMKRGPSTKIWIGRHGP
jgi:2-polyprenyl-3-methyl-5-hydroxy-6-metoxy-1,4-benzoquinol methylase